MAQSTPMAGGMVMGAPPMGPPVMDSRNIGNHFRQFQEKEIYQYDAPWPVYGLDWSKVPNEREGFRVAIGSLIEDQPNKLQIVTRSDLVSWDRYYGNNLPDFIPLAETEVLYPVTKILWEPRSRSQRHGDILVTSSDVMRIWELVDNPAYGRYDNMIGSRSSRGYQEYRQSLVKRSELVNVKQREFCAPLTSFDWNELDPSLIVASSIDTTCTVWNIETGQAKTQLIAHDRDVYDVAFMHGTADIFASVGADGSVRLFDLRSLEHSTILYEAPTGPAGSFASAISDGARPLLRLQFNRLQHDLLATFHMESDTVHILDIRFPSTPVAELSQSHRGNVNCFSWSPNHPGYICTGGDDKQVLVWDIQQQPMRHPSTSSRPQNVVYTPSLRYEAELEVNSLSWNQSLPMWIGIGFGRTIQALRV